MNNIFSENLKKLRKDNDLSQEQLSEKLGVSRQSISKWESNQAYPEMEKILQICNMFNLNIDDLLNKDIKELKAEKDSKLSINKYIEEFLNYITDSMSLFINMNLKSKIKCLFEQVVIISILYFIASVVGMLLSRLLSGILYSIIPIKIYYYISNLASTLYFLVSVVAVSAIVIHIFKTRYLDYYLKTKKAEHNDEKNEPLNNEKDPKYKEESKIVIRDPKHSEYKFVNGLLRSVVWFIKAVVFFLSLLFCASLGFLSLTAALSFLIAKSGIFFLGGLISIIGLIIINVVILVSLFNFVFNRKTSKRKSIYTFVGSLIITGIGIGISTQALLTFDFVSYDDSSLVKQETIIVEMIDEMAILNNDVVYIESDSPDVTFKMDVYKYCKADVYQEEKEFYIRANCNEPLEIVKSVISEFNNKRLTELRGGYFNLEVYASKENIEKIKMNSYVSLSLKEEINDLKERILIKDNEIFDLKEELYEKEYEINDLEDIIDSLQDTYENN